jgi:wyosine [tRNA(Phe)-imidazoG37] synthetase (radical SAM superfamily)
MNGRLVVVPAHSRYTNGMASVPLKPAAEVQAELSVADHSRHSAGLRYVYPVVSRRAGGVSIGINLNPNNACNWRCIYCQVPDLKRGAAPPIDVDGLETELRWMLSEVLHGDFLARRVPESQRRLNDLALSGNGEPTSAGEIEAVIDAIGRVRRELAVSDAVQTILITNGSLMRRRRVQAAVRKLAQLQGAVWFKLDRATEAGIRAVNNTRRSLQQVRADLETAVVLCPTWIQTCLFAMDGMNPSDAELAAYVELLRQMRVDGVGVRGVLLYGLARPSQQPEAARLSNCPAALFESLAGRLREVGYAVRVTP